MKTATVRCIVLNSIAEIYAYASTSYTFKFFKVIPGVIFAKSLSASRTLSYQILCCHISRFINLQQIHIYSEFQLHNLLNVYASVCMYITWKDLQLTMFLKIQFRCDTTWQVSRICTGVSSVLDRSQDDSCFVIHSSNEKAGLEGDESRRMGKERKCPKFEIKKHSIYPKFFLEYSSSYNN